ncbi:MAG TPA: serine/threonine-protein kinase [Candidatus Deferrimicrobium sp.]|nr:serine/threonine-protein kinase [Candidatus Deferrimicrobium sp.]
MADTYEQLSPNFSRYEKLGEGPSGQVYRAWDRENHHFVALKVLWPHLIDIVGFRARLASTIQALAGCEHPNLATVYRLENANGRYFVVSEYIEGITLRELITCGPMDNDTFLHIAMQIADGLAFAHDRLVTHGNLKPSNVILTEDGRAKIMDFGLPWWRGRQNLSKDVDELESLAYLSPDQIARQDDSPAADLFASGVLFYEMLTGRRLAGCEEPGTLPNLILIKPPELTLLRSVGVPRDTTLLVEKLLSKDSSERLNNSRELSVTLREMQAFEREAVGRTHEEGKPRAARQYLALSLLALLLVVFWFVVTTYRH